MISRRPAVPNSYRFLPLLLAALAMLVGRPAAAGFAEGSLRLLWTPDPDHPKVVVVQTPASGYRIVPLAALLSREHRLDGLPAGMVRLELRAARTGALTQPLDLVLGDAREANLDELTGRLLASWDIPIGLDRTTTARLDPAAGHLEVDDVFSEPFGQELVWDSWELQTLPHTGTEAVIPLDTRLAAQTDPILNDQDLHRQAYLRPRPLQIDGDPSLVQISLSGRSARRGTEGLQISTYRPARNGFRVLAAPGTQDQVMGQGRLTLKGHLGSWSPFETEAVIQSYTTDDAGPVGILDEELQGNDLDAIETRVRAFLRPWGRGLAELEFYAFGQERHYYLHEFRLIPDRAPRQDQADLRAALVYDLPLKSNRISLGLSYSRAYMETGDGTAYDVLESYSPQGQGGDFQDNGAASDDGLYWNPGRADLFTHVYNYYTKHLATTWRLRAQGSFGFTGGEPLRAGLEYGRATYRWYEHSRPSEGITGQGYGYVSHLGYSPDASDQADSGLNSAPSPTQIALYATQEFPLGPGSMEAGVRVEHFRSGQRPAKSMVEPSGIEGILNQDDLEDEPSVTGIDPRIGYYMPAGRGHLWADVVQSRELPPYSALYFSPNVLQYYDNQIRIGAPLAGELIFGNPELEPEVREAAHLGYQRPLGRSWSMTLAGTLARIEETWVAKAYPSGLDTLYAYANAGTRRELGMHFGIDHRSGEHTRIRLLYDLSRLETNVIEPAPLYRGRLLPGGPLEGTAVQETAPLEPVWIHDGERDDYHPSLFDRTHTLAAVFLTRLEGERLGPAIGPLLRGADFALTVRAASGAPYTPVYVEAEGLMGEPEEPGQAAPGALTPGRVVEEEGINSARKPWTWTVDLALRRYIGMWGGKLAVGLQILNLLDQENVRRVYGATGEADDDGWLASTSDPRAQDEAWASAYRERLRNPWNYEDGITGRITVSYSY